MFWHALPPSLPNTRASGVTALPNHYTGYRCGHRWQRDKPKMTLHTYFSVPFSEMSKQFSQLAHKTKKCVDETGWWECVCVWWCESPHAASTLSHLQIWLTGASGFFFFLNEATRPLHNEGVTEWGYSRVWSQLITAFWHHAVIAGRLSLLRDCS